MVDNNETLWEDTCTPMSNLDEAFEVIGWMRDFEGVEIEALDAAFSEYQQEQE